MKSFCSIALLVLVGGVTQCVSFVVQPTYSVRANVVLNAVELVPEPEGGEEITPISTMGNSKMKNMGEATGVKNEDGPVYKFWLTAEAGGALIKEINTRVMKDASKKANFPGFRKGQVPPYALPQIRGFAVQEGIVQTCQAAVNAYGLKSLSGSDGEVEVLEDIPEVAKNYKAGDDVPFTCTFNAMFDPEKAPAPSDEGDATVIDAEIVE